MNGSYPTGQVLTTVRAGNLPARPSIPKKQSDFPAVHQWTRKDFRHVVAMYNKLTARTD
jgi:hypothetical protein